MYSLRKAFPLLILTVLATAVPSTQSQDMSGYISSAASKSGSGIANWYKARNNQGVWDGQRLGALAQFIQALDAHGLSPNLFQFTTWDQRWRSPSSDPSTRAEVEVGTTQLALYAIQSLAYGYVDPTEVHSKWKEIQRQVSSYQFLEQALQQPPSQFAPFLLQAVPPQDQRYAEMVKTLAHYRKLDSMGGWRALPATAQPAGPGLKYPELNLLRSRLQAEGDLPSFSGKKRDDTIDTRTGDAIKSFQFRHGIEPDGYIGGQTLAELNTPTGERVNQIIVNIDRLRWMPRTYEDPEHIEVNIAENALRVFRDRREIMVMPTVVGVKGVSETPVFHGKVQYMVFRPYWNVPTSIAKKKLVPAALSAPEGADAYMRSHNYQIVSHYGSTNHHSNTASNLNSVAAGSLLMQQGPGPNNSLGLIKFIFPNDSAVYLHDTNMPELFQRADRDFSSGCVRVQRPVDLAMFLLRQNSGWSPQRVQQMMNDPAVHDKREDLAKSTSVYLNYWTCTIMGDGRVRFDRDIYGHDTTMFQRFGMQ